MPAYHHPRATADNPLLHDEQWLAWAGDQGLDLTNRRHVLDAAAVGMTVLCWRNTRLEDAHAGTAVAPPDIHAAEAGTDHASRDDDHTHLVAPRRHTLRGAGIPDHIMMRVNISTARQVRAALDTHLPATLTRPGTRIPVAPGEIPDHASAVAQLLHHRDRAVTVGAATLSASRLLADDWPAYQYDMLNKITIHLRWCDLIGVRRAVWHLAISAAVYAPDWYPSPWWDKAVHALRTSVAAEAPDTAGHPAPGRPSPPPGGDELWHPLLAHPQTLSTRQCQWVMHSRLHQHLRQAREADRQRLGPLPAAYRFPHLALIF